MVNCELYFVDSDLFIVRCQLRNVSCQKWTALKPVLEVSRGVLSRLGSVLTSFWNHHEASWTALERSWRRLGGSKINQKSDLEQYRVGKTIGSMMILHFCQVWSPSSQDFGCPRLSKWSQKWSKIETKTWHQIKTVLSTFTDRFLRQNWDQNQTHV